MPLVWRPMSPDRPLVVGIGGSIRNRANIDEVKGVDRDIRSDNLIDRVRSLEHRDIYHDDFLGEIQPLVQELTQSGDKLITNSDALVLTALYGAKDLAEIEFVKLTEYFGRDRSYASSNLDPDRMEMLGRLVSQADGLILGSPVYFGDRSSLMHSFINYASDEGLLEEKVVGAVSVGSKRNGGQETTNVYALFESLNYGAIVVGNGPKTCQYGGTGWAGDIGVVTSDEFGLETSLGTGLRVSRVAELQKLAMSLDEADLGRSHPEPFRIGVLLTRDKDGALRSQIEQEIARIDDTAVQFDIVDFSQTYIQACIGCDVCPTPAKVEAISGRGEDYKCIIDEDLHQERWADDELQNLHHRLMGTDALVIAALDTDERDIMDTYQALLERTRYIRRDDWRLHNIPLMAYVVTSPGRQTTYPMKIMTSWMRHNTIVHRPGVYTTFANDGAVDEQTVANFEEHYNEDARDAFASFVDSARRFRAAAQRTGSDVLSYKATGYRNKILDETVAERT